MSDATLGDLTADLGRLPFAHWGDADGPVITVSASLSPDERCDVIRRLVAVWNACQGISTKLLEAALEEDLILDGHPGPERWKVRR